VIIYCKIENVKSVILKKEKERDKRGGDNSGH
jgi:hypothetical protein